jgi:hypothetical protein
MLGACGFRIEGTPQDAPPDVPPDVPPDALAPRTRVGLIAFWTFDDPAGSVFVADTSGAGSPVPLEVISSGGSTAPAFVNGTLVATSPARLVSSRNTRLPPDCASATAVTFEIWVRPGAVSQGSVTEPAYVAGIAGDVANRDVALMQAGTKWLAQVRTTAATSGMPNLISASNVNPTAMAHVVVVADSMQRVLYVDGVAEATGAPGGPSGWDPSYAMTVFDEYQHARWWVGSAAMVALYNRALTPAEISRHHALGPDAP